MILRVLCIAAIGTVAITAHAQEKLKRVFGYDPVALVLTGKLVQGTADIAVNRYEFTYLFSNQRSKEEFLRNPKKYEFQFGGACGRMGPLSGIGNPNHFLVKDGKLYAFASAPCKQTFEKYSERLLEADEPKPKVSKSSAELGKRMAEKVLAAHGGRKAILELGLIEAVYSGSRVAGNRTYQFESRFAFDLKRGKYADGETWDGYQYGNATDGKNSCFVSKQKLDFEMHPDQVRALGRKKAQHLLSALWAIASRRAATYSDATTPNILNYWNDGVSMKLEVSPDGKVVSQEYTGRGPDSFMCKVRREFTEWQKFNGVVIPILWKESNDGKASTESHKYVIQPLKDPGVFSPSK